MTNDGHKVNSPNFGGCESLVFCFRSFAGVCSSDLRSEENTDVLKQNGKKANDCRLRLPSRFTTAVSLVSSSLTCPSSRCNYKACSQQPNVVLRFDNYVLIPRVLSIRTVGTFECAVVGRQPLIE